MIMLPMTFKNNSFKTFKRKKIQKCEKRNAKNHARKTMQKKGVSERNTKTKNLKYIIFNPGQDFLCLLTQHLLSV